MPLPLPEPLHPQGGHIIPVSMLPLSRADNVFSTSSHISVAPQRVLHGTGKDERLKRCCSASFLASAPLATANLRAGFTPRHNRNNIERDDEAGMKQHRIERKINEERTANRRSNSECPQEQRCTDGKCTRPKRSLRVTQSLCRQRTFPLRGLLRMLSPVLAEGDGHKGTQTCHWNKLKRPDNIVRSYCVRTYSSPFRSLPHGSEQAAEVT